MKYKIKITLSMLCLVALLFGVGGSAIIGLSFYSNFNQAKETAAHSYQGLLSTLAYVGQISYWGTINDIIYTVNQIYVQSDSAPSALQLSARGNVYTIGESDAALEWISQDARLEGGVLAVMESEGRHYICLSEGFQFMGETLYFDAAYDISSIYESRSQMQKVYSWIFAAMVAVCAGLAYAISSLLTTPLSRLLNATDELAKGNLKFRSNIDTNDEIGALSRGFDTMAAKIEENMTAMQEAMERQERFMGSFSHELKTPLTSMIGYAELIQSQALSSEDQMEAGHFIYTEGKRLENLSLKLLDILVAGRQSLPMISVPPASLVREVVAHLRPPYREQGITLDCNGEDGVCNLDPDLVKSLLMNLLDNAKKAITSSGHIRVRSHMTEDGCVIIVEDNGKGIPAGALVHLTEAFYRVDQSRARERGGTGLGLSLCQKIVELHHGTMQFESLEGSGTKVVVTLRGGRV